MLDSRQYTEPMSRGMPAVGTSISNVHIEWKHPKWSFSLVFPAPGSSQQGLNIILVMAVFTHPTKREHKQ